MVSTAALTVWRKHMADGENIERVNGGEPVTERYARQALTQTAKGWKYETTVSIKTEDPSINIEQELEELNLSARYQALAEIAIRASMDDSMVQKFTNNLVETMGVSVHGPVETKGSSQPSRFKPTQIGSDS